MCTNFFPKADCQTSIVQLRHKFAYAPWLIDFDDNIIGIMIKHLILLIIIIIIFIIIINSNIIIRKYSFKYILERGSYFLRKCRNAFIWSMQYTRFVGKPEGEVSNVFLTYFDYFVEGCQNKLGVERNQRGLNPIFRQIKHCLEHFLERLYNISGMYTLNSFSVPGRYVPRMNCFHIRLFIFVICCSRIIRPDWSSSTFTI